MLIVASSRIYQQERDQAHLNQLNITGLLLMSAAPVMHFLGLPKNILLHYRINQICIKILSNNQSHDEMSPKCAKVTMYLCCSPIMKWCMSLVHVRK